MNRILSLILLISFCSPQVFAAQKPNILFLAVDDMNDWIGCLGTTPRAITPNLDRLAARGLNFTNAHTAGVFCAPSRAAIFSGQFASTTGCYRTANYFVHHPEIEPLQVSFSKAGYQTFGAGKLFHHPAGAIDVRGWNEFFLRNQSQREGGWPLDSWSTGTPFPKTFPSSIYNKGQQITGGLFLEWGAVSNSREEEIADTMRVNWAVEKLKEKHDKPFFLGVGLYAPHFPNYCPQKYFDLYDPDQIKLPPYKADDLDDLPPKIKKIKTARSRIHQKLEDLDAVDDAIHGYLACISYADAMMGRVLDALDASPYADNTIVVLWSDHGYHHGEKGDWGKHTLWERTSNVPFIWAGPGVAKGQESDVTVSLIDMYPTLIDLVGLAKPHQELAGESLVKTLADPTSAEDRNVFLPHMNPGEYAVINRDWRYIRYGEDGEELYDLQNDPNEWHNLASSPEQVTRKAEMRKFAPETFAQPAPNLNVRKDLVIDGETFRWEKGKGNYKPSPKRRPAAQGSTGKSKVKKGKNVLFIMVDDLGKEWISCYGSDDIKTPNIDALAAGGMTFNNAYSMPSCTSSRTMLLTGKYPWRNGYVNHWDVPRWGVAYFDWKKKENTTFARLMKDLGYATYAAGKWQINDFRVEPQAMKKHGFDDWAMWTGSETGNKASEKRYYDAYINTPEGSKTYEGKFGPDVYTDHLIKFMRKHKEEPMCLYYPMALVHRNWVASPDEPKAKSRLERHRSMVSYADKMVGKLIKSLDDLEMRDRTIVIFTTDNGTTGGRVGFTATRNGTEVVGAKGELTEAGVCAPFIVNCPGMVPEGVQTDALTDFSDMLPTFLELGGGDTPEGLIIDGTSIASVMLGKNQDSQRQWIMSLGGGAGRLTKNGVRGKVSFATRVIRDKKYKVWVSEKKKIIRLHDLERDPSEEINLLDSDLETHKKVLRKFQAVVDSLPDKDAHPIYEPRASNPWDMKLKGQ